MGDKGGLPHAGSKQTAKLALRAWPSGQGDRWNGFKHYISVSRNTLVDSAKSLPAIRDISVRRKAQKMKNTRPLQGGLVLGRVNRSQQACL